MTGTPVFQFLKMRLLSENPGENWRRKIEKESLLKSQRAARDKNETTVGLIGTDVAIEKGVCGILWVLMTQEKIRAVVGADFFFFFCHLTFIPYLHFLWGNHPYSMFSSCA